MYGANSVISNCPQSYGYLKNKTEFGLFYLEL